MTLATSWGGGGGALLGLGLVGDRLPTVLHWGADLPDAAVADLGLVREGPGAHNALDEWWDLTVLPTLNIGGLGANERGAFWEVTLPLAKTGIVAGFVLGFALSFEEVSLSLFLYDPASFTLPVAIVSTMRAQFNLVIAAASVLIILATVALVLMVERLVGLDRAIGGGVYRS